MSNLLKKLVILVYPRIDFKDNYSCTWLPYSVLYIADALRKQGLVDVAVYDANIHQEIDFVSLVRSSADRLLAVGFSIMTGGDQIGNALDMARDVCAIAPHAVRFFGGPHANVCPQQTCAHPLVDAVAVGPGQYVVPPFIASLLANNPLANLQGVWIKSTSGEVVEPVSFTKDWIAGGMHDWQNIDAEPYVKTNDDLLGTRVLNYISSLGCCFRCRFCYEQNYGRKYHAIPADQVITDVQYLIRRYHLSGLKFYDADFFVKAERAEEIWSRLAAETPVAWAASIHPNDVLRMVEKDPTVMNRMAECGCKRLLMGIESGNDRVLSEVVCKMTTREKILKATEAIDAAGIRGAYTFILGFPGEHASEKQETVDFAMRVASLPTSPEVRFHGFAPYPGTPMYEDACAGGFVPPRCLEEWSHFDYYSMRTPWLTPKDEAVIHDWSKVTGRRLVERQNGGTK